MHWRQAPNGKWYTEKEFLQYYKDNGVMWRRAGVGGREYVAGSCAGGAEKSASASSGEPFRRTGDTHPAGDVFRSVRPQRTVPSSQVSSCGQMPTYSREALARDIFATLDEDRSGSLNAVEMHRFAQLTGFSGAEAVWQEEFHLLCEQMKVDVSEGITPDLFVQLIEDKSEDGCYCPDAELSDIHAKVRLGRVLPGACPPGPAPLHQGDLRDHGELAHARHLASRVHTPPPLRVPLPMRPNQGAPEHTVVPTRDELSRVDALPQLDGGCVRMPPASGVIKTEDAALVPQIERMDTRTAWECLVVLKLPEHRDLAASLPWWHWLATLASQSPDIIGVGIVSAQLTQPVTKCLHHQIIAVSFTRSDATQCHLRLLQCRASGQINVWLEDGCYRAQGPLSTS